jgi:hypothetical protein
MAVPHHQADQYRVGGPERDREGVPGSQAEKSRCQDRRTDDQERLHVASDPFVLRWGRGRLRQERWRRAVKGGGEHLGWLTGNR